MKGRNRECKGVISVAWLEITVNTANCNVEDAAAALTAAGFSELGKEALAEIIAECGFEENVRGETLSIAEFASLSNAIYRRKAK